LPENANSLESICVWIALDTPSHSFVGNLSIDLAAGFSPWLSRCRKVAHGSFLSGDHDFDRYQVSSE
jgi:hypothetical protein